MGVIVTNNRELIPAPESAGRRLRYGIFNAATPVTMPQRVIAAGLQFYSDHCGNDTVAYDQTCVLNPTKPFVEGSDLMGTLPFWLLNRKRCGAVGRSAAEMNAAVREGLYTGAQTRVEDILWDGNSLTGVANLTGAGATIVTPGAPGAGTAIAALEAAFYAVNGYVGTIHMNTRGYAAARDAELLEWSIPGTPAGVLTTPLGSVWSIGAGYGITGPANVAPAAGFVWAFMTSQVTLWRSGVLPQRGPDAVLDRTLNQWDVLAEEIFAATWDCPEVFAVQVPIAAPQSTTAPAVP